MEQCLIALVVRTGNIRYRVEIFMILGMITIHPFPAADPGFADRGAYNLKIAPTNIPLNEGWGGGGSVSTN